MTDSQHQHLQHLNPEQLAAVEHFRGPILILAGAGSGKTRVLTRRVANLVISHRVPPERILAVTFTNKATEEMRERLHSILGGAAKQLWVATFHSAALRILRRHAKLLNYTQDFVVYDDQDSKSLLKSIIKELDIDDKKFPTSLFSRAIDQAKNHLVTPEKMAEKAFGLAQKLQAEVYDRYQRNLLKCDAMDFGDLLFNVIKLFRTQPKALELYQHQIEFVLVDEFQDTNPVQYEFVRAITKHYRNLLVVGDDDQSIYAFRGATISNILEFENDFPDTKVIKLEQNYRSTGTILELAHAVITHNKARKNKKLWTEAPKGGPVVAFLADDEQGEAAFVAREIAQLHRTGIRYSDMALFYRVNAQSRALEEALIANKIPYRIFGGLKFYDRKEIKDITAYLRLLIHETDNQSFLRVVNTPPRGIGAQAVQAIVTTAEEQQLSLLQAARVVAPQSKAISAFVRIIDRLKTDAQTQPLGALIHAVLEHSEYWNKLKAIKDPSTESRLENLQELESIGNQFSGTGETPIENLKQFLDRISLASSADIPEGEAKPQEGFVSLMTLHLAKGLEYPYVFFTGLEEGLLPHYRSLEDALAIEEERRLCYVGITRAMKQLYLTRSVRRGMFSGGDSGGLSGLFRDPSRFINEMPPSLLNNRDGGDFVSGSWSSAGSMRGEEVAFSPDFTDPDWVMKPNASASPAREGGYRLAVVPGSSNKTLRLATPRKFEPGKSGMGLSLVSADSLATNESQDLTASLRRAEPNDLVSGARIIHPRFGAGIVDHTEGTPENLKVVIKFESDAGSLKKLSFLQAKLALPGD